MFALAALAIAASAQPQVRASVRILTPARATARDWQRSGRRRELVIRDGSRLVTIRLIEYE